MKTDTRWRKSSYSSSQGGDCLEVRDDVPGTVPVRDSKLTGGPVLTISTAAWTNFLRLARR
ncbi:DUF397 domain-containing protein [Streptomyces sp. DSM 44915]|uniref:DUF397 domain-containing protein n=1 Tax=Streptomyces chisholmiae TaxID=3075540 RepID=A0ABU2JR48_9ACTN|nr:DUF397 domain-containing protein [Streptomyces sp. DSM 44915]MDT0267004.1 DUF397 domain-containing protein [Streptomyces sp. DSM 44915]